MASDYTGDPAAIFLTISLLDDGDKRNAQSVRVPLERIIDSLANLDPRVSDAITKSAGGNLSGTITVVTGGAISLLSSGTSLAVHSGAAVNVASGGQIAIASGATIDNSGEIELESGGLITVKDGATINVQAHTATSGIAFANSSDLTIASAVSSMRLTLSPQFIAKDTGPTGHDTWYDFAGSGTWEQMDTTFQPAIRFPLYLAPGEELTSVLVACAGGAGHTGGHSGTLPDNMPAVQVVKVSSTGTRTVLARKVDPSASAAAYDVAHSVNLVHPDESSGIMPITLTGDPHYIEFLGEWGASDTSGKLVLTGITCTTKQKGFRSPAEFG